MLQPAGIQGLPQSAVASRLLLVATLDGTLHAFDRYSGVRYWENGQLGGPMVTAQYPQGLESKGAVYLVEPHGAGNLYAYLPGTGIKGLVNQSPLRWPDGTYFLGKKATTSYALDISTGMLLYSYTFSGDVCPTAKALENFAGDVKKSAVLIVRSEFQLLSFPPTPEPLQGESWKLEYSEYGGFVNPFTSPPPPTHDHFEEHIFYSSFNGIIAAKDKESNQIMWVRQLSTAAIGFFKLSESLAQTGPTLIPIPIGRSGLNFALDSEASAGEEIVNIGDYNGTLYVLSGGLFPFYRQKDVFTSSDREEFGDPDVNQKQLVPFTALDVGHTGDMYTTGQDCRPGSPDFPKCLIGSRVAQILQPVPLLGDGTVKNNYSKVTIALLVVVLSSLGLWWLARRRRVPTIVTDPSILGSRPPGFEEISISSADVFYSAQSAVLDHSLPRSFTVTDQVIGYGSHGTVVFKGVYDNRPVAIKRMLADFYDLAGHEVNLLQQSDHHPNVIRYFCRERTEKFSYIVLELCSCSLAELIEDSSSRWLELRDELLANPQDLLRQITEGLGHLHEMKLVHRDIKPHNILVTPQHRVVISDFGLGKKLADDQSSFHPTVQAGTVGWRAPESILSEEAEQLAKLSSSLAAGVKISKNVDIFALGCVYYYVLSKGRHPFGSRLQREINIINSKYDISDISVEAADLITRMLDRRPEKRPTCPQILAHPFYWGAQKQVAFLLDLSDRFEFEDRQPSSKILAAFEARRKSIFEGNNGWHKLLDSAVWYDLCSYRKYNGHSARDLLRALRNKRSHFHELSPEIRAILGETPEAFMNYFLNRFPRLLIEAYRLVETTGMKNENPFSSSYFVE
ncbi:IRE1 [Paramicrosporidium saccamoebae]|uniref:non-specific serine/threonine protein kinase n=1 Tax=Paramicrosporidium saccamoebae TaxID=1246581 RepID=A0A2H9TKE4_9FUNG|nr:IRE1 [Paramicrosporidium saccamoebae]